jgi:hypothetical protein
LNIFDGLRDLFSGAVELHANTTKPFSKAVRKIETNMP